MEPVAQNKFGILFSIFGNAFLLWSFVQALLLPASHATFFFSVAPTLMVLEFFNLHSTGMTMGANSGNFTSTTNFLGRTYISHKYGISEKLTLLGFYSVFALVFLSISGNYSVIFYFILSLVSKIFINKGSETTANKIRYLVTFGLYVIVMFFCFSMGWLIKLLFPLPMQIQLLQAPAGSGLMNDAPQIFVLAGVLYFLILIIVDVRYYFTNKIIGSFLQSKFVS